MGSWMSKTKINLSDFFLRPKEDPEIYSKEDISFAKNNFLLCEKVPQSEHSPLGSKIKLPNNWF